MIAAAWAAWTRHRVVYVNANALLAGVVGAAVASVALELTRPLLTSALWITGFTAVVDGIADAGAFVVLHWVAARAGWDPGRGSLATDAAKLQLERIVLSPLFYLLALVGQWALLNVGVDRVVSVWVAYIGALVLTRALHTVWGLRSGTMR